MSVGINVVLGRIYCGGYAGCSCSFQPNAFELTQAMVVIVRHLLDFHQKVMFLVNSVVTLQMGMKIAVVLGWGETGRRFSQSK